MTDRLFIVGALLLLVVLANAVYRRWRISLAQPVDTPPFSAELMGDATVDGAPHAWIVFTTPYCASCGPVMDRIGTVDPGAPIVTVNVGDRPDLADRFSVRTAPTVFLAGSDGSVRARLVGNVPAAALAASLA